MNSVQRTACFAIQNMLEQTDEQCSILHFSPVWNQKPIDRIRAIIRMRPLITDTQPNTLDW